MYTIKGRSQFNVRCPMRYMYLLLQPRSGPLHPVVFINLTRRLSRSKRDEEKEGWREGGLGPSLFSCLFTRAPSVPRIYYHSPTGDNSGETDVLRSPIWIRGVVVIPVTSERQIPRRMTRAPHLGMLSGFPETRYESNGWAPCRDGKNFRNRGLTFFFLFDRAFFQFALIASSSIFFFHVYVSRAARLSALYLHSA